MRDRERQRERKEKVSSKKGAGKMRRSLRLFCIIPFFLLFALPPTVHASLKAPRRVSSSPHILKPGEEDAFLESQLKSSSSVTPSSTPTSGDDDRHHHQQHKHHTHEHAHRIVKKEHHKRAASHEWTDSSKEVDTKTLTAKTTVKSSEERPHVGVYGATSSIKTASSSSSSSSSPSPSSSPSSSSSSSPDLSPEISPLPAPNFPLPFCAECDGCAVDWTKASISANSVNQVCAGTAPCSGCDDVILRRINGTYALKNEKRQKYKVKREVGASAATVLRADYVNKDVGESFDASGELLSLPFVKFPCIPGLPRHNRKCARQHIEDEKGKDLLSIRNVESVQKLSDFCGLENVASRAWSAKVKSTAPAGIPIDPWSVHPESVAVDQLGAFTSPAAGIGLNSICQIANSDSDVAHIIDSVPSEQIVRAALYEFIFCSGDRHTQNVFIDDDARVKLIDNDNLLGWQVYDEQRNRLCAISSLFLPGNLESWRVRESAECAGKLGSLDYRCHVNANAQIKLPRRTKQCLEHFKSTSVDELVEQFGIVHNVFARTLKQRSIDLLDSGLPKALENAMKTEHEIAKEKSDIFHPELNWDEMTQQQRQGMVAVRDSFWRRIEPPNCAGVPMGGRWDNAVEDLRA